jgi:hypothetical protein
MIAAMHKRTKISCKKLIQVAINNCMVPTIQNYIRRNYMKNTTVGVVGASTFPFAFASHFHKSVGILPQQIEKNNITFTWFNW